MHAPSGLAKWGATIFFGGLAFTGLGVVAQETPQKDPPSGREQVEQARSPGCDAPGLAVKDRTDCITSMNNAADDAERSQIRAQYEAMAQGNRTDGDGIPTASPPPEPRATAPVPSEPVPATYPMGSSDAAWLITVGGGALVLGAVLFYGVTRRRRGGAAAKAAQDRGTRAVYGQTDRR